MHLSTSTGALSAQNRAAEKLFFSGWPSSVNAGQTVLLIIRTSHWRFFSSTVPLLVWDWENVAAIWGQWKPSLVLCVLLKCCSEPSSRFLHSCSWPCPSCLSCLCFVCLCRVCNRLTSLAKMHQPQFLSLRHSQCGTRKWDVSASVAFSSPQHWSVGVTVQTQLCGLETGLSWESWFSPLFHILLLFSSKDLHVAV